jgi:hypothetical protein
MSPPEVQPYVGMGATVNHWSDRYPATIIQITHNGKRLVLQEDKYTRTDQNGMSECQEYSYEKNEQGDIHFATQRKDGTFRIVGSKTIVSLGVRSRYYDFSF